MHHVTYAVRNIVQLDWGRCPRAGRQDPEQIPLKDLQLIDRGTHLTNGPIGASEWWQISDEFLDDPGALSVALPDLDDPAVKAVLDNATEAAAGGMQCAAYFGNTPFSAFLDYANFGAIYDPDTGPDPASANQGRCGAVGRETPLPSVPGKARC
ncbi:hypothetical protein [Nocardia sp. NPDC051463]|uniref:hypothetical protein n=1 Tax=Nocardia sp. NPDC051463 TaxID=3154845 RepID=UPI00344C64EE